MIIFTQIMRKLDGLSQHAIIRKELCHYTILNV